MANPLFDAIARELDPQGDASTLAHGTLAIRLPPAALRPAVERLKNEFGFDLFLDVTAVDWPEEALRFEVVSAHFMERECHEMYGIAFRGNDDLRPILLYEGFKGHPLRKDYPKQLEQPLVPYRR